MAHQSNNMSGKRVKRCNAAAMPTMDAQEDRKAPQAMMELMAYLANPATLDNPAYPATIHQSHCLLMADADGARTEILDHPDHPDLPDLLEPKAALALLAAVPGPAVLDPLVPLVMLVILDPPVIPDPLVTAERMQPRAVKETQARLVAVETLVPLEPMAIVVPLENQAQLAIPDHKDPLVAPETQATKDQTAHPVHLAALVQMPNTVHALVVPRKLKQSMANSRYVDIRVRHVTDKNMLVADQCISPVCFKCSVLFFFVMFSRKNFSSN